MEGNRCGWLSDNALWALALSVVINAVFIAEHIWLVSANFTHPTYVMEAPANAKLEIKR